MAPMMIRAPVPDPGASTIDIRLETKQGELVGHIRLPSEDPMPDTLLVGFRIFVHTPRTVLGTDGQPQALFVEATTYTVTSAQVVQPTPPPVDRSQVVSTSSRQPSIQRGHGPAPEPIDPATGQHGAYWVLSEEERRRGFVRPVRRSYQHLTCRKVTTMGIAIAETYARDPTFYSKTMCVLCKGHFPVAEFVWLGTEQLVGT